jgi:hypothetical protein
MKIIHLLLFSLLIFTTCNNSKSPYCENELALIQADSLPIIELDFKQSEAGFEKQLLAELHVDSICIGSPNIGFPLKYNIDGFYKSSEAIHIRTTFYNACRSNIIFCGIRYDFLVLLNQSSEFFIHQSLDLQQDSILKAFQKEWEIRKTDFDEFMQSRFILRVFLPVKNDDIKTILDGYIHFYLMKMDEYCRKEYGENLCDIDKKIVEQLKTDFPFQIHVCYTTDCSLLPPPPLEELNL